MPNGAPMTTPTIYRQPEIDAALAVIKWKKLCGFYLDLDQEHHSTYTLDGNAMDNEERHVTTPTSDDAQVRRVRPR